MQIFSRKKKLITYFSALVTIFSEDLHFYNMNRTVDNYPFVKCLRIFRLDPETDIIKKRPSLKS